MGSRKIYTYSVATLSWIDPRSRFMGLPLPECDVRGKPAATLLYHQVSNDRICRFSHLLTCSITVENGGIIDRTIAPESGLYVRPSFLDTAPREYGIRRDFTTWSKDMAIFAQTVGCRTQAPELVGRKVGEIGGQVTENVVESGVTLISPIVGIALWAIDEKLKPGQRIGRKVGREAAELVAFPPIWTTLYMVMFANGTSLSFVKAHSLFPSMTFYEARSSEANVSTKSLVWQQKSNYDGVPHLDEWRAMGWGKGNPWRVQDPSQVINDSIR